MFPCLCIISFLRGVQFIDEYGIFRVVASSLTISFLITAVIKFTLERVGFLGHLLFRGGKPLWTVHEQYAAYLSKARHARRHDDFDTAMVAINHALKQDPNWPEALFIKAQILWEGFESFGTARMCLAKIMKSTSEGDPIHKKAQEYSEGLNVMARSSLRRSGNTSIQPGNAAAAGS